MSDTVLITGANGFLGTQVAIEIIKKTDLQIIAMVRGKDLSTAITRLKRNWWDWPELINSLHDRVQVICGEISRPDLGLAGPVYEDIKAKVTHIIHTAADLRLDAPVDELRMTNVQGTANLLKLAFDIHKENGLKLFSHVSTAYVAGSRKGQIPEEDLSDYGFSSNYELSKYESELLVDKARKKGLPISVFRPGMVIGDSKTGRIKTFNTIYFPLRLYLSGRLPIIPVRPTMPVNLIPVDFVAEAITTLTLNPSAAGLNFHLTLKTTDLPTVKELIEFTRIWAGETLGVSLPKPVFIPLPIWKLSWLRLFFRKKSVIKSLLLLAPYLNEERKYKRTNLDYFLPVSSHPSWKDFLPKILEYAVYMGFLHRSERTVHEQVIFRLSRRNRVIKYYDIQGAGRTHKIIKKSAGDLRREVLGVASSLKTMGIKPGDRIAIVGLNSTRYLTLDLGIGLAGAVSVPLYYTSPSREIKEVINDSKPRVLFVGAPKVLEIFHKISLNLPVVSFCFADQWTIPPGVISWEKFFASGDEYRKKFPPDLLNSPVSLGDIATIRYTSGTTGKPKGIIFTHHNLRFMAESLACLPPWRSRFKKVRYLSFLPMNHVVEGILATYSLYYAPAPVDVYFLEDFTNLKQILPTVRPTFFFSVPRFYEKVWEQLETGLSGCILKSSVCRQIFKSLIKTVLLRRIGLNKCAQLIVGSAPINEQLLSNFRDLGVEIHNAYGLTEAPLVTMNRSGKNKLGTVGEPLPKTEIAIAEDGEILVKGPQVMAGAYNDSYNQNQTKDSLYTSGDPWLRTGDLGYLTKDGYLTLYGRKKEVIVTSYGKNIYPVKIESLLKMITGVSEAIIIGDERPYCTALLWVEDKALTRISYDIIKNGVQEVNRNLSHPEQIKRWAVISERLSIEEGELTANLKLKRQNIIERYMRVISALYNIRPNEVNPPPIKGVYLMHANQE